MNVALLYNRKLGFLLWLDKLMVKGSLDVFVSQSKYGIHLQTKKSTSKKKTQLALTLYQGEKKFAYRKYPSNHGEVVVMDPPDKRTELSFEHEGYTIWLVSGSATRHDFAGETVEKINIWVIDSKRSSPGRPLAGVDYIPFAARDGKQHIPHILFAWLVEQMEGLAHDLEEITEG